MKSQAASVRPLVTRPSRWLAGSMVFLWLLSLGGTGLLLWFGAYAQLPVPGIMAVLLGVWAVALLKARTEVRQEGLYNQGLRRAELLPWAELTRVILVETPSPIVTVVRRDGRNVRLAGLLGRRSRQGPQVNEIVAVVQEQIDAHRPADAHGEPSAPPTIERRLGWGPVRRMIISLTVLGLIAATAALFMRWWLVLLSLFLLSLAGFMATMTARNRTVVGPDGIRNRVLRKETFIPWDDVADVIVNSAPSRYVKVARHSGSAKTLAAVSDGVVPPDGIPFDALVEVIRQRAGLGDVPGTISGEAGPVPGEALAEVPAEPVSVRPSRLPVLWMVPLALALLPVAFLVFDNIAFFFLTGYLFLVPLVLLGVSGKLLRGRTDAGPDGIRNRMLLMTREVRWSELDRFIVQPTLFGRVVQVVRTGAQKRTVLAAPREGLLGRDPGFDAKVESLRALAVANGGGPAAVDRISPRVVRTVYAVFFAVVLVIVMMFWRPWLESWWPTQHQATSLPRACALADEVGPRLVPGGQRVYDQHNDYQYSLTSRCSVLDPGSGPGLEIEYNLQRRTFNRSGTAEGRDEFASERSGLRGTPTPVSGLGDEALQSVETDGRETTAQLLIRRENVVIVLKYEAQRPADQLTAELQAVARTAISRIGTD